MSTDVVTRFAPSPSGELHLGNVRTALFNYLLARHCGGRVVLRIEDTDAERSHERFTGALLTDLVWLGLHWDEGPDRGGAQGSYRQSQRGQIYAQYFAQLQDRDLAYPCFCTPLELELSRRAQRAAGRPPRYAGTCSALTAGQRAERLAQGLKPSLRFRVPAGRRVEFQDLVHGLHSVATDDIGDFIVRRADGSAAFFFCNAIDDALMGITDVLRGEDHLANTPRQLLLLAALALRAPRYGHVSLLLGGDGTPLSKRNGAQSVRGLREQGYSSLAICNQLFRLGHSTPLNTVLSLEEMAVAFDLTHLQRSPAQFDPAQLRHWQREWVHGLSPVQVRDWLAPSLHAGLEGPVAEAFFEIVRPNIVLADEARLWQQILFEDPLILDEPANAAAQAAGADFFVAAAGAVGEHADLGAIRRATGRKGAEFFQPLRAALTGRLHGPELAPLLAVMSTERVRSRLMRFGNK